MRYYVVSDIHSFYTEFIAALTEKGYFADEGDKKLIMLGDLFDRGNEPLELQQFILDRLGSDELILIKGNHEDLYEKLIYTDRGAYTYQHKVNGTFDSALAFTGMTKLDALLYPVEFADAAEGTPLKEKIIPAMRDYYETENFIFVHGWLPCTDDSCTAVCENWRDADSAAWAKARWTNGMAAAHSGALERGKTVVCGHWHSSWGHCHIEGHGSERGEGADYKPYYNSGIIAIDACTAASGFVNCLVIED